jgi:hypothetical protein
MTRNRICRRRQANMKAVTKIAIGRMHSEADQQHTQKPSGDMDEAAWLLHTSLFHERNEQGEATLASP